MLVNNPIEYALQLDKFFRGEEVKCPECKKGVLKHRFFAKSEDRIGFAQFQCPECNAEAHLSRVSFPEGVEFEEM